MAHRMPSPAVLLLMTVSAALFLGLAAWGWACLVVVLLTVAALFSGINLCGCKRPDTRGRWIIAPLLPDLPGGGVAARLCRPP